MPRHVLSLGTALGLALTLTACGASSTTTSPATTDSASTTASADTNGTEVEVKDLDPRIVITYDGGILVLDTATGQTVADIKKDGFLRLNPAGDGRHVLVSSDQGFEVLDTGLVVTPHGDHNHYYTTDPTLTGSVVTADHPGHVVTHAGRTALWADGSGVATTFSLDALEDGQLSPEELSTYTAGAPHHGVAIPLSNGNLLVTEGTTDDRHTVREISPDGLTVTETTDCPGVHGEAAAQAEQDGDAISLGCENGSVVYSGGTFHKVAVPEEYQRSGNQFGSPVSPYVLTDYKTVKPSEDSQPEHPTVVGIINSSDATVTTLDLGSSYWFRSFARGADGEGLVLTYDGKLNIIDLASASVTHQVDVVTPWTENEDWQEPGPNVKAAGDFAYVTDPTAKTLTIVQVSTGEILSTIDLPVVPNETAVIDPETTEVH